MAMVNAKQIKRLIAELRKQLGREPTFEEFRKALHGKQ